MSERLDRTLTIRLNPDELTLIRAAAKASRLTVSAFIRAALDRKLGSSDNPADITCEGGEG